MKLRLVGVAGLAIVFVEPAFAQQTTKCDGPQEECQRILTHLIRGAHAVDAV